MLFGLALNSLLIEPWFTSHDLRHPLFPDGMKTRISSRIEIKPSMLFERGLLYLRSPDMPFLQFRNPFIPIGDLPPETSYIE